MVLTETSAPSKSESEQASAHAVANHALSSVMLEILKVLVEAALKLLNPEALEKFRREGKQREVGTRLFGLYVGLVDLFPQADILIKRLKHIPEIRGMILDKKWIYNTNCLRLREIAERQSEILRRLERPLAELRGPLIVIDAEAANVIEAITWAKSSLLETLISLLEHARLPMEVPALNLKERDFERLFAERSDLREIEQEALPPLEDWSENDFVRAAKYAKEAEQQLSQLREACQKLRAGLESNFSVKEILPELGAKLFDS